MNDSPVYIVLIKMGLNRQIIEEKKIIKINKLMFHFNLI